MERIPRALSVAGSDSGGGAGIQADLKTFAALGVHGLTALTAVTAQNTRRVLGIVTMPPEFVALQIDSVVDDIGVDAVKTGMLPSGAVIEAVADRLERRNLRRLVVDPVMISTGGDRLIDSGAVETLRERLLPLALVVTPNLHEAEVLADLKIGDEVGLREAARRIHGFGPTAVIVKGGHREDPARSVDLLFDGVSFVELPAPRIDTRHTHGSGCTFSAALAAFLARGEELPEAARRSKQYVTGAIRASYPLGDGHGPLGHFWKE